MRKHLFTFSLLLSVFISSAQITNGLIANYNFNACNATDGVTPQLNGIDTTNVQHSADRFGNPGASFLFNGTSSYIKCGHAPKLLVSTGLTISAWIKLGNINGQKAIVSKWNSAQSNDQFLLMVNGNKTFFAVANPSASANGFSGTKNLVANTWYHIVATWDNTGSHQTYVDGVLDINTINATFASINTTASTPLTIGSESGTGRFFEGNIDDVQIFNRKLNTTEINTLFTAPNAIVNHLVSKYSFDSATLNDDVNMNHGYSAAPSYTVDRFGIPNSAFHVAANTSKIALYDSYDGFSSGTNGKASQSFWIKFANLNTYQFILAKSSDGGCGQNDREFLLRLNASNKLEITSYGTLTGGNNISRAGQTTISTNQWYHVVLTYDASISIGDKFNIYLNSTLETLSTASSQGIGLGNGFLNGKAQLGIGHALKVDGTNCSSTQSLSADFDDYLIYNNVINQTTIDSLYNVPNVATGIPSSKIISDNIMMFPNPVLNTLHFSENVKEISVFDITGKSVIVELNAKSIDLSFLSKGIYIVVLKDEKDVKHFEKIVKQ